MARRVKSNNSRRRKIELFFGSEVVSEKEENGDHGELELRRQAQAADDKPGPSRRPPSLQCVGPVVLILPQPSSGESTDKFDKADPDSSDDWLPSGSSESSRASSSERRERGKNFWITCPCCMNA